jgi:hypothetical protein
MAASGSRQVLLRLKGDSGDARRAINEVRSDLRRMSAQEASIRLDIQTARVERQIATVREQLKNLARQDPSPTVDIKTARATERLALLELRLDRLNLKKVNIDVDVKRGGIERTAAALGTVDRGIDKVVIGFGDAARGIPIFGQVFAAVLQGVVGFGNAIGQAVTTMVTSLTEAVGFLGRFGSLAAPLGSLLGTVVNLAAGFAALAALAGGLVIALNAILGAVVALAGALVALVASLAAAIGGLGALAVAFGGVLIPIVAVAIGLFTRFAAIIKARQAREQELTQAVQAQKTAEQQRKDALDAARTAHQQLAQATVDGNRAMAQSAIDLRDAELGLASSKLGVKEARLNLREAQASLREFLTQAGAAGPKLNDLVKQFSNVEFNPADARGALTSAGGKTNDPLELQRRILAVQRSQLGVKEAINQTAHAEQTLADATRRRADFVRRGLNAYRPYRAALEQVRRSEIRVARSQDATTAAQRKYEQALKGLSGTEKTTLSNLDKFLAKFKELAKAFSDPVFKAINDVFDSLSGKSGFLKDALVGVGRAMGDAIRQFGRFLGEPRTITAFKTMANGAADLVRTLGGSAFTNFLRIMREVATTALPAVRRAAHDVAGALQNVANKPAAIHRTVSTLIGQFKSWARLAGSLIGLIKDIFVPASKQGKNLADSMRHIVDRWREWLRANPEKVREFFRTSVRRAKEIVQWIAAAVDWLKNHLPKAAASAKRAFDKVYAIVKKIVDAVNFIKNASHGKFNIFGHDVKFPVGPLDIAKGPLLGPKLLKHLVEGGPNEDAITKKLAQDLLKGLRDPTVPRRAPNEPRGRTASAASAPRGDFIAHITVPGGKSPDERVLLAKLAREAQKLGLVG